MNMNDSNTNNNNEPEDASGINFPQYDPTNVESYEPPANVRQGAKGMWDLYMSLQKQGFSEDRAFEAMLRMVNSSK